MYNLEFTCTISSLFWHTFIDKESLRFSNGFNQIWWSDSDGFAIRSSSETESLLLSQKFTHPLFAWPFPLHIELIIFEVKCVFSSHDHRSIGGVPSRSRVLPTCTLTLAISAWLLQIWMYLAWLRWTKPFPSWFDFVNKWDGIVEMLQQGWHTPARLSF